MISRITANLFIGEYSDVVGQTPEETQMRFDHLNALGVEHVLSLCSVGVESCQIAKEAEAFKDRNNDNSRIHLHHQPVPVSLESAGKYDPFKIGFQKALKALNFILFNYPKAKILIHCGAGVDRAPFLVASFLVRSRRIGLADAYKEIKRVRPSVCEHFEWVWW